MLMKRTNGQFTEATGHVIDQSDIVVYGHGPVEYEAWTVALIHSGFLIWS